MTDTKISTERLTEYEMQVLIGTTTHGCTMTPDRVFSLDMAWHRLHAIGLIDRTDGLAIATNKGQAVVDAILAFRHQEPVNESAENVDRVDYDKWQFLNDTIDRCRRDAAEATAKLETAEAERDAALAELAKLKMRAAK